MQRNYESRERNHFPLKRTFMGLVSVVLLMIFICLLIEANPMRVSEVSNVLYDETGLIDVLRSDIDMIESTDKCEVETINHMKKLFDNDIDTFTDVFPHIKRPGTEGYHAYIIFDFKEAGVNLSRVELMARQDRYYTRIEGMKILGSNDRESWTELSDDKTTATRDWQVLNINKKDRYRYIMFTNKDAWFGNIAELRMFQSDPVYTEVIPNVTDISIRSDNEDDRRAYQGNKVMLRFSTKGDINKINARIDGKKADIRKVSDDTYEAEIVHDDKLAVGLAKFHITYLMSDGTEKVIAHLVTDNSSVFLSDERNLIDILNEDVEFIDSTTNRNKMQTLQQVSYLFDNKKATNSDFRLGSGGNGFGAYIIFDFKNKAVNLSRVEVLARQDQFYTRISGLAIYGSDDGVTWDKISENSTYAVDFWQALYINKDASYRYIKVINDNAWFGNMAELRLFDKEKYEDSLYVPRASKVSIASDHKDPRKAFLGNKLELSFTMDKEIPYNYDDLSVIFNHKPAAIIPEGNNKYVCEYVVDESSNNGLAEFEISYLNLLGKKIVVADSTTDNTSVFMKNKHYDESVDEDISDGDESGDDLPGEDFPVEDVPGENVPVEDIPDKDVSGEDVPEQNIPDDSRPAEDNSAEDSPENNKPGNNVPEDSKPQENVPVVENKPAEDKPVISMPEEETAESGNIDVFKDNNKHDQTEEIILDKNICDDEDESAEVDSGELRESEEYVSNDNTVNSESITEKENHNINGESDKNQKTLFGKLTGYNDRITITLIIVLIIGLGISAVVIFAVKIKE